MDEEQPAAAEAAAGTSREQLLQDRLDEMRRERQAELKAIREVGGQALGSGHRAINRLLQPQQQQQLHPQLPIQEEEVEEDDDDEEADDSSRSDAIRAMSESARAVLAEVRGLFDTRPVSTILQSSSFRTELESVVRSNLTPRLQQQQQQRPTATASVASSAPTSSSASSAILEPAHAAPVASLDSELRQIRNDNFEQRPHHHQQQQQQRLQQPPATQSVASTSSSTSAASEPVQAAPVASSDLELRQIRHDEFVQEISSLLHTQLVTNALTSGFRSRLERSVRRRAETLQDGGQRAIESLGQLPPSNIVRNDFSHLGIIPADQQSMSAASDQLLDDAVSMMSAAAAAAAAPAEPGIGRQMRRMQKEFSQMKRMMQQLAEGQLETQRMIRQEISAALSGAAGPAVPASQPAAIAGNCLICLSCSADTVMYRCGHLCMCATCAGNLRSRSAEHRARCPVCRAPVTDMLRVFSAGAPEEESE